MLRNSSTIVVNASGVDAALKSILKEYGEEVHETVEQIIPEVAKEGAKKLKASSPKGPKGYAKGWTTKLENGRTTISAIIHGRHGTYQLAHLLEKGHALRGGGRSRAIEHIAPVDNWVAKEVPQRIIERLS